METLQQHLFEHGVLSLREVLRLLLLSGLFTVACVMAFPRNAPTRRMLLLAAVTALAVLPWALASIDAVWFVALEKLPPVTLEVVVPNVLLWTWLSVATLLVIQHLLLVRREVRQLASLPRLVDERAEGHLTSVAKAMDIAPPVVRVGDCACSTTLAGPLVTLPPNWKYWDDATLRSVLAHELTHIARRDDRWLLLTRLLVLSYWWMPWLIWLYRVYVRVMEESCDDAASEIVGHHLIYVGALVEASVDGARRRPVNAANMHEHHLVGRVGRFADTRVVEVDTSGVYWFVIGILLVVVALTGIEPVQAKLQPYAASISYSRSAGSVEEESATAVYPMVFEHTEVAERLSEARADRLRFPRFALDAVYPGSAIREGVEGDVVVEFSVSADGGVTRAVVVASEPPQIFDASALRAVIGTRYGAEHAVPVGTVSAFKIRQPERAAERSTRPHEGPMRIRRYFRYRLDTR